jgi:apolipoprotein N-acyltransferase
VKVSLQTVNRFALPLAFPVGALLAMAFAPMGVWPLAILCPAWLFLAWQDARPNALRPLASGSTPVHFWPGLTGSITHSHRRRRSDLGGLLLLVGLVVIMGAYLALIGYLRRLLPRSGCCAG